MSSGRRALDARRAVRLPQGYVWHPRDLAVDLADHAPATLSGGVHAPSDPMPAAPFTFFDDDILFATQQVYQLTVLRFVDDTDESDTVLRQVVEHLQTALEGTTRASGGR